MHARFFSFFLLLTMALAVACSSDNDDIGNMSDDTGQTPDNPDLNPDDGDSPDGDQTGEEDGQEENLSIVERLTSMTGLIDEVSSTETNQLAENVTATEIFYTAYSGKPMAMFIFEAYLAGGITITQTTPYDEGIGNGKQRVTQQALEVDSEYRTILGGSNADFFTDNGPQGICHHNGIPLKTTFNTSPSRPRSFFYITRTGLAKTAPADEYSDISAQNLIYEACGGGPVLVSDGKAIETPDPNDLSTEPRTCIGASEDGKTVYIMVVDGRQTSYSNGMDFSDMAVAMEALGCHSAINLDGGGSSTFYIRTDFSDSSFDNPDRFEILNSPSDGSERAVWNGLAIIQRS